MKKILLMMTLFLTGLAAYNQTPALQDCPLPADLAVTKISETCVRLNWKLPGASVEHVKIKYRRLDDSTWIEERKNSTETTIRICDLVPNTTYVWKIRNICADDKTEWIKGPKFTTLPEEFSSNAAIVNGSKVQSNAGLQVMPNPNKGNFSLQMQLSDKAASTTLILYNNLGATVWQENAGRLSGSVNRNIALENKLQAGVYVLIVQHGAARLAQKVVVAK